MKLCSQLQEYYNTATVHKSLLTLVLKKVKRQNCLKQINKQIASGKLLYSTGNSARCSVMNQRGRIGARREAPEGGDMCILIADLHCCIAETNTTL